MGKPRAPRKKKGEPPAETSAPPTAAEEGLPGYRPFWLNDAQRAVNQRAITYYMEAVEASQKKDAKLGVPVTEHRRLLRVLGGTDTERGLLQIFMIDQVQQGDTFYDEQVPSDTEVRDALKLAEVEGASLHLIATLAPEQKREVIEWAKKFVEAKVNGAQILPARPAYVDELFPLPDNDPLLADIEASVRDDVVNALSQVLGKLEIAGSSPLDSDLEVAVAFQFEQVHKKTTMGFFKVQSHGGNQVACYVAGGAAPLFAYGVNPDNYGGPDQDQNPPLAEITGARLLGLARKILKLETPAAPAAPVSTGDDGFEAVETLPAPGEVLAPEVLEKLRKEQAARDPQQMEGDPEADAARPDLFASK